MNCPICGKEKVDDRPFCGGCGHKFGANIPATNTTLGSTNTPPVNSAPPTYTPPAYTPPAYTPPAYTPPAQPQIPAEYKPLGAWMYCLWSFLFSLQPIGLILLIVMACGGTQNINLRNYARSYFCAMLVSLVLVVLGLILIAALGVSFAGIFNEISGIPLY